MYLTNNDSFEEVKAKIIMKKLFYLLYTNLNTSTILKVVQLPLTPFHKAVSSLKSYQPHYLPLTKTFPNNADN